MTSIPAPLNLIGLNQTELANYLTQWGEKPFHAKQILHWIHHFGLTDSDLFSDISKSLRETLKQKTTVALPSIIKDTVSSDGTRKWLLKLDDGNGIETVFIPEKTRGTLCISSQAGCALQCQFCLTGKQGFNRNLRLDEIIGQVFIAVRALSTDKKTHDRKITNVVFMGMGEPLLNINPVIQTIHILINHYGLSKRRVTVSTSGIVPAMKILSENTPVSLAVSLHAPDDLLRNDLMPINKKYNLDALMQACQNYFLRQENERKREILFEYVMLDGINDQPKHAYALAKLFGRYKLKAKVNLIPFNTFAGTDYQCSPLNVIQEFSELLKSKHIFTTIRKTRGPDIIAACGQLAGEVKRRASKTLAQAPIKNKSFYPLKNLHLNLKSTLNSKNLKNSDI